MRPLTFALLATIGVGIPFAFDAGHLKGWKAGNDDQRHECALEMAFPPSTQASQKRLDALVQKAYDEGVRAGKILKEQGAFADLKDGQHVHTLGTPAHIEVQPDGSTIATWPSGVTSVESPDHTWAYVTTLQSGASMMTYRYKKHATGGVLEQQSPSLAPPPPQHQKKRVGLHSSMSMKNLRAMELDMAEYESDKQRRENQMMSPEQMDGGLPQQPVTRDEYLSDIDGSSQQCWKGKVCWPVGQSLTIELPPHEASAPQQ